MGEKCPKCGKEQSHNQRVNWTCEDKDCGATVHGSMPSQMFPRKSVTMMAIGDSAFLAGWDVVKGMDKGDNVPTNPSLWAQAKSKAKSKFKVYPSAYANGWASKWYKSKGGGWKKKGKKSKK